MDIREEFRTGWREGLDGGGPADEARRLLGWLRRLPGTLTRFAVRQLRALWGLSAGFLRDALRGSPVLLGIIFRSIAKAARAAGRRSAGAGAAAPPAAAAVDDKDQEQPGQTAQHAEQAPHRPPWAKLSKAPATAAVPGARKPEPGPAGKSLADIAETAGIGFLVLVLAVTFGGMALGVVGSLIAPYASGLAVGVVAVWCVAAATVAARPAGRGTAGKERDEPAGGASPAGNDHERLAGEEGRETDPWPARREAIRAFVEAEVAAGNAGYRDAKGKGAPVDALLAELQRRGAAQGWDRNAMLDLLERAGITVRQQMKFRIGGKAKTPPGVHVDDLAGDLGFRPRIPAHLVPDLTPEPGPSREAAAHLR